MANVEIIGGNSFLENKDSLDGINQQIVKNYIDNGYYFISGFDLGNSGLWTSTITIESCSNITIDSSDISRNSWTDTSENLTAGLALINNK